MSRSLVLTYLYILDVYLDDVRSPLEALKEDTKLKKRKNVEVTFKNKI
jgi:hypothetical protein